jgi:V8-like Glu-specific endopeptidase
MAFAGYLRTPEVNDLTAAALTGGLVGVPRATLLAGMPPGFVAAMPVTGNPLDQFTLDLLQVNGVERMAGGEVPLLTFLENAVARLKLLGRTEERVFGQVLSRVGNAAGGVPSLPDPRSLPEIVKQEQIIGLDDTLDLDFFGRGLEVARAVAQIAVARFDNGVPKTVAGGPWVSRGTAWLPAPDLAMTNHHVVNARMHGEPAASDADFLRQAQSATLTFDFDAREAEGTRLNVLRPVAFSRSLDYALLELAAPVDRPIPLIQPALVELDATSRMTVNIIQHPRGEHKQVAFRNNLVSAADDTTVRYFTDTDQGSSGSPVCDDRWRVVALHRGARHTDAVQFQGRTEAFVNFGSQIQAVLADIRTQDAAAADRIAAAQAPRP